MASRPIGGLPADFAAILLKAGLSSIPLAALVIELGQSAIAVINQENQEEFLHSLASKIDECSCHINDIRENISRNSHFSSLAHSFMLKIAEGTDDYSINMLRNATVNVPIIPCNELERVELSRAIKTLSVIHFHFLIKHHEVITNNSAFAAFRAKLSDTPQDEAVYRYIINEMQAYKGYDRIIKDLHNIGALTEHGGGSSFSSSAISDFGTMIVEAISDPNRVLSSENLDALRRRNTAYAKASDIR